MKNFPLLSSTAKHLGMHFCIIVAVAAAAPVFLSAASDIVIPVPRAEDASQGKNLLRNGDVEQGAQHPIEGWSNYEKGYGIAERQGRRSSRCIMCENSTGNERRGAVARIALDQARPIPLYVEGWSKAERVSGASDANYSIYVDCLYSDGTPLWGTNSPFATGTHGWEKVSFFVTPAKPIKSLSLYLLFRSHSGKVWFDDIKLTQLASPGGRSFDGVPTLKAKSPRTELARDQRLSSQDGLAVGLDMRGCKAAVTRANGLAVKYNGSPAGFFVRDAASQSAFHSFRGTAQGDSTTPAFSGEAPSLGLRLNATLQAKRNHIEVSGTLTDTMGVDRATSLYFALPVEGGEWVWWDDVISARDTKGRGDFRNVAPVGAGANGTMSRYPLSAISDSRSGIGLSIAVPMENPRLYRIAYDADRGILYIAYDFGLCRDAKEFPGEASFKFVVYSFDPRWGFRAAMKKYYDLYPQFFTRRLEKEGLWMAFHKISAVEGFEDFGFAFKEGANETKFDDEHEILTFRYTEPQSYWQRMPKEADRSYDGCVSFLEKGAAAGDRMALATTSSGIFDPSGRYNLSVRNTPWCDGCVFALNPSPRLIGQVTKANVNYEITEADRRYADIRRGNLDGEYLDSLEGWSTLCNFRREHFATSGIPLTFDTLTKKPCILNAFSIYEFAEYISQDIHRRGKLMMANSVPIRFGFFCHLFDTCGIEINWKRGGSFRPDDEWIMNYRRAMMFQKPYLFLMNTGFESWSYQDTEKYMRRCVFYAFYPSFFSADASTGHYFSQPKLYNRDRPLFKKYVPIIRALNRAGWQPVTHARTSDPDVRIERYGDGKDGKLYFSFLNTGKEPKQLTPEIDLAALCLTGKRLSGDILTSSTRLRLTRRAQTAILSLNLPPGDTEAVGLRCE